MKKNFLVLSVVLLGLGLSLTVVAKVGAASNSSPANITFPVPELGNCASQDACKAYCDDASHMQACVQFAQSHGLISQSQASQGDSFAKALANGGGPGGCDSPTACQTYCSTISHLEACLSFAKSHGLNNGQMADGQKILAYLKTGGVMPGGCDSQTSCQNYCNELSHIVTCSAFVEKAGLTPPGGGPQQLTSTQVQKLAALAQSGQTPGGCTTNDACQTYCNNPDHAEACQTFATAVGFSGPGGPGGNQGKHLGPGGCDSPQSCQSYCGDPSHQEECLKFAGNSGQANQPTGINSPQGGQQPEQTVGDALNNVPSDVLACVKSKLGSALPDAASPATQGLGQAIQTCFASIPHNPPVSGRGNGNFGPQNASGTPPLNGFINNQPNQPNQPENGQFGPMNSSGTPSMPNGSFPNNMPQQPQNSPLPAMPQNQPSNNNLPPPPQGTQPTQPTSFNSPRSLLGSLLAPIESLISR